MLRHWVELGLLDLISGKCIWLEDHFQCMCLVQETSLRQHYKNEHWACNTQAMSGYELPRGKTNKMTVRLAKTQINLGIRRLIRVFAVRIKKAWVLSYPLSTQRRLCSDWADTQADLSLRWADSHFVGFVMRRLICLRDCWIECTVKMKQTFTLLNSHWLPIKDSQPQTFD